MEPNYRLATRFLGIQERWHDSLQRACQQFLPDFAPFNVGCDKRAAIAYPMSTDAPQWPIRSGGRLCVTGNDLMVAPARALVEALLSWYGRVARDLPWRRDPVPYKVLLSELMLQQTRVDTVIPYFDRFVARWPTLEDLASASEDDVLHEWAGLGYYSRARNLHRCAQAAAALGGLPSTADELRALPGIGPYTSGAIASIAFGQPAPLIDGNVERVISRLDARSEDPRSTPGKKALWARAGELVDALEPGEHPGALNQALMELGATVCLPRNPGCLTCPVRGHCMAGARAEPEAYPKKTPKKPPVPIFAVYALARTDQGWVLGRRPKGLLGNLWEPIGIECAEDADPGATALAALRDRAALRGADARLVGTVKHVFSHRKLTARVVAVTAEGTPDALDYYTDVRVVQDVEELTLSKLARKLLAHRPGS